MLDGSLHKGSNTSVRMHANIKHDRTDKLAEGGTKVRKICVVQGAYMFCIIFHASSWFM